METDICVKWPAARLLGPKVAPELALEFIRRTDAALVGSGFTNDHGFDRQLRALLGLKSERFGGYEPADWQYEELLRKHWGHVPLQHLASHWVECASIDGPYGPVHPDGTVRLTCNFGKWPSVAEVESDLDVLAAEFPWLEFHLSVWGATEEGDGGPPTHTWHLCTGAWQRASAPQLHPSAPSIEDTVEAFKQRLLFGGGETTWSVQQITAMWGPRMAAAAQAARAELEGLAQLEEQKRLTNAG